MEIACDPPQATKNFLKSMFRKTLTLNKSLLEKNLAINGAWTGNTEMREASELVAN